MRLAIKSNSFKKMYPNDEACLNAFISDVKKILLSCCLAIKVYKTNYCLVPGLHPLKAAFQIPGTGLSALNPADLLLGAWEVF